MRLTHMASNVANFSKMMERLGVAIDDKGDGGAKITKGEAEKLIGHMDALPKGERAMFTNSLMAALQGDYLDVSDDVRKMFAESFNVTAKELTPRQVSDLAGQRSKRTAFQHKVKTATKATRATKKMVKDMFNNATKDAPPMVRSFFSAALEVAQQEGVFKFDSDARPVARRFRMGANHNGEVDFFKALFQSPIRGPEAAFAKMMSNATCFEDVMAAIFFYVAAMMQDKIAGAKDEFDDLDAEMDRRVENQAKARKGGGAVEDVAGKDAIRLDLKDMSPEAQKATKGVLQSVINAADTALKRDYDTVDVSVVDGQKQYTKVGEHKSNFISAGEAVRIAKKLERLGDASPAAEVLMAHSITTSLLSADNIDLESMQNLGPILQWGQRALADHDIVVDISKRIPKGAALDPQSQLSAALVGADGVPSLFAGFMVDVFTKKTDNLSETMKTFSEKTAALGDKIEEQGGVGLDAAKEKELSYQGERSRLQKAGADLPSHLQDGATGSAAPGQAQTATPAEKAPNALDEPIAKSVQPKVLTDHQLQKAHGAAREEMTDMARELQQLMATLNTVLSTFHQMTMNTIKAI